jgi:hypothetical protein
MVTFPRCLPTEVERSVTQVGSVGKRGGEGAAVLEHGGPLG